MDEVASYALLSLPRAALAAGPRVRYAAEQREAVVPHSDYALTVERIAVVSAGYKGLCLYTPPAVEEAVVVTVQGLARYGTAEAAAEAGMWWVDRSLKDASGRVVCCLRLKELSAEKLYLYSRPDENTPAQPASVRRLRVPSGPFTLHVSRLAELRTLQLSPTVARLVVELDVRSCLRWSQEEVHGTLNAITAPLRGVRVPTVSLPAVTLLRRFHSSLRVLYLFRRTSAVFHDAQGLGAFDDEETEEEETRMESAMLPAAPTAGAAAAKTPAAPPRVAPARPPARPATQRGKAPTATSASSSATAATTATTATTANRPTAAARRSRPLPRLPPNVIPVLEELHISNSVRRRLPQWVSRCLNLRRLSIHNCRYDGIAALRHLAALEEVTLESCALFTRFDSLCHFLQLRTLAVKNCGQLRSIAWLPRLSGALVSLTLHHLAPVPLVTAEEASTVGVGLDCVTTLHLSAPVLRHLRPLLVHAAATLRELTLFTCINADDFAELPALPSLERLLITGNRHMQSFTWLSGSPLLTEVRATQCTQLTSLNGLGTCRQLRMLDLTGAAQLHNITDARNCTALTYVDLSQCLALNDVAALRRLPQLRCVMLRNCMRLPKSFGWLSGCPNLEELVLPSGAWFDAASEALQQLGRWDAVLVR